jgi:hypothetical protein
LDMDQCVKLKLDGRRIRNVKIARGITEWCCLSPILFNKKYYKHVRILSDVLQWTVSIFCRTSYNELYPYSVGRLTMNYIHILSDVLQWTISIFCRTSYNELYPYSVGRLTMNYIRILSDVLQWTISIFCRTSYNELYPYSVGRLTMNYIDILSEVLQWTIPYSVGRLTENHFLVFRTFSLHIADISAFSPGHFLVFFGILFGGYCRHCFLRLSLNCLSFSGALRWIV